jgi:hypothetical protein
VFLDNLAVYLKAGWISKDWRFKSFETRTKELLHCTLPCVFSVWQRGM